MIAAAFSSPAGATKVVASTDRTSSSLWLPAPVTNRTHFRYQMYWYAHYRGCLANDYGDAFPKQVDLLAARQPLGRPTPSNHRPPHAQHTDISIACSFKKGRSEHALSLYTSRSTFEIANALAHCVKYDRMCQSLLDSALFIIGGSICAGAHDVTSLAA